MSSVRRLIVAGGWYADGSDRDPIAWPTYRGGQLRAGRVLPAETLSLEGTIVVKAAAVADQELRIRIEAAHAGGDLWQGTVRAEGPGLDAVVEAQLHPGGRLAFAVPQFRMELRTWEDLVQRLLVLPGGRWELEGLVTAEVFAGSHAGGKLRAGGGRVDLRDGRLVNAGRNLSATGIEASVEFEDFDQVRSRPGTLRVAELTAGAITLAGLEAEFAFVKPAQVRVAALSCKALGGQLAAAEPFNLFLDQRELAAVVVAEGLQLAEILALAKNVPASAVGRVDGRLPVSISPAGLRLGTGWLALMEGTTAELQLKAADLRGRGSDPHGAAVPALPGIEAGLMSLRVSEMRMDLYPPDRPPGRSATLRIAGTPVNPTLKAPVVLDLHVNGPVEMLLNIGLGSRLDSGGRP